MRRPALAKKQKVALLDKQMMRPSREPYRREAVPDEFKPSREPYRKPVVPNLPKPDGEPKKRRRERNRPNAS